MEARGTGVRHGSFNYRFCALLVLTWSILKYQPSWMLSLIYLQHRPRLEESSPSCLPWEADRDLYGARASRMSIRVPRAPEQFDKH